MSIQVSMPLALHLRAPVTFNIFTNQRWRPGEVCHLTRAADSPRGS